MKKENKRKEQNTITFSMKKNLSVFTHLVLAIVWLKVIDK